MKKGANRKLQKNEHYNTLKCQKEEILTKLRNNKDLKNNLKLLDEYEMADNSIKRVELKTTFEILIRKKIFFSIFKENMRILILNLIKSLKILHIREKLKLV